MISKSGKLKFWGLPIAVVGLLVYGGEAKQVCAQRDPFAKPAAATRAVPSRRTSSPSPAAGKPKPSAPAPLPAPPIEDRIAYYKRLREKAAINNEPLPNPTVVMTLDELSVSGIFQSSRGYAAIVEAKPIKLSYTVYPGDKFFDGQLIAVEENSLVFKRVTKWSNGKFIAVEENKPLRQYTVDQQVQGTVPIEQSGAPASAANTAPPASPSNKKAKPADSVLISPLEEMNRQPSAPADSAKSKSNAKDRAKSGNIPASRARTSVSRNSRKKPVKVAANTDQ